MEEFYSCARGVPCEVAGSRAMPSSATNGTVEGDRLWAFERQIDGRAEQRKVVLGVDGGGTCTVCVCVAAPLAACGDDDDLPFLSRVETGSSNYNSVGGRHSFSCILVTLCVIIVREIAEVHHCFLSIFCALAKSLRGGSVIRH